MVRRKKRLCTIRRMASGVSEYHLTANILHLGIEPEMSEFMISNSWTNCAKLKRTMLKSSVWNIAAPSRSEKSAHRSVKEGRKLFFRLAGEKILETFYLVISCITRLFLFLLWHHSELAKWHLVFLTACDFTIFWRGFFLILCLKVYKVIF